MTLIHTITYNHVLGGYDTYNPLFDFGLRDKRRGGWAVYIPSFKANPSVYADAILQLKKYGFLDS